MSPMNWGSMPCIDYKNDDVAAGLKTHCPDRIDMYFENVGGPIGNAAFHQMNIFAASPCAA